MANQQMRKQGREVWGEVANVLLDHRLERWHRLRLTTPQLRLMGILERAGCRLAAGAMAGRMHVSPPVLTRIADRLVAKGFIDRAADTNDRRVVMLQLRQEGRAAYHDAVSWAETFLESVFEEMGDQAFEEFVRSGERFVDAARAVREHEAADTA